MSIYLNTSNIFFGKPFLKVFFYKLASDKNYWSKNNTIKINQKIKYTEKVYYIIIIVINIFLNAIITGGPSKVQRGIIVQENRIFFLSRETNVFIYNMFRSLQFDVTL